MIWPLVNVEKRGVKLSPLFVVPRTSKSMNPASTRVAPGPNWLRVIASLFQKMLLNSALGLEKPGAPAGRGAWNSGSFASEPRPAACGTPMGEFSHEGVVTVLATVFLLIRALAV